MRKNKMYQPPVLKVVAFKVENGFLESNPQGQVGGVNYGGSPETGIITDDLETNKSGLDQYGYQSLFQRN